MLAGTSVNGSRIMIDQEKLIGKVNGMSDDDINKTVAINTEIYRIISNHTDKDELKKQLTTYLLEKRVNFLSAVFPKELM